MVLIIVNNYIGFTKIEREEIVEIAKEIIENDDNIIDKLFYIRRKNYIYERLIEYLEVDTNIILEGFVNFRLKEYRNILEDLVDFSVNEYIIEREYLEFISLLRIYVNSQPSSNQTIHLIFLENDTFLLDENMRAD